MTQLVRTAAYAASQHLAQQGLVVKRSHLSEVIAALLGYGTHAALTVDEANLALDYHLDDAEILVLNRPMGEGRARQEGMGMSSMVAAAVVTTCIEALVASAAPTPVFVGIADFYDAHARQALAEAIYEADDVADVMAGSNAMFPEEPELPEECPLTTDLWTAAAIWTIEADGEMTGEYDPDGDRMFNGDTLQCRGWLSFLKAGRAGLLMLDSGGGAAADDSWRDAGSDDDQP
ncbi:hypothetical protein DR64_3948 [Paraburkholderia xenovorans LB400]|uniref:Uncharacterized protein n=1 Tax=Paraburkholderia xenovorans (strain LB400) TaxID=266265 RepID=Q13XL5_PARXL|nr:hypothetical protein [Paraburkholderia xenovorans]ABE31174.1 hypothetical protein Bxe_A1783 [Paraburkholderia xenovorans LB400]AIP30722.1 hypothetical protein DR64_3948 [Paraburkholderia xenovorans LB400]